jgi:hypothetical protein
LVRHPLVDATFAPIPALPLSLCDDSPMGNGLRARTAWRWALGVAGFAAIVAAVLLWQGLEAASWWAAIAGFGVTLVGVMMTLAQSRRGTSRSDSEHRATDRSTVAGHVAAQDVYGRVTGAEVDGPLAEGRVEGTAQAGTVHRDGRVTGVRHQRRGQ